MNKKSVAMFIIKYFIIFVLSIGFGLTARSKVKPRNYCTTNRCGTLNIGCNAHRNFSYNCYPNARLVPMRPYKGLLLKSFNNLRNKAAGGEVNDFAMAARMAKMSWCKDLQNFAELNVLRCRLDPKKCMSTDRFYYIEHFIELFSYSGPENTFSTYQIMHRLMEAWFRGVAYIDREMIMYLPDKLPNVDVAKATLLLSERNTHVGCAALRYSHDYYHHMYFSCAFSTINFIHRAVFKLSRIAGKNCKKRRDKEYPNLCGVGEKYDNANASPEWKVLEIES